MWPGSPQPGSATGTDYTLDPGSYTVSEDALAGYTGSFSGDCAASGEVVLALGEEKLCTITNNDERSVDRLVIESYSAARTDSDWGLTEGFLSSTRGYVLDPANFGTGGTVERSYQIGPGVDVVSAATLAGVDVFFTGWVPSGSYTEEEKQALRAFVLGGGTLIATTDDTGHSMVDVFGLIQGDGSGNPTENTITEPGHPLANGPFGAVTAFNQYMATGHYPSLGPDAHEIGRNAQGTSLAVIERGALGPGSGAVILVADVDVFSDEVVGGAVVNATLIKNVFAFAAVEPPRPALSIGDVTKAEGDGGTTIFDFTVSLSPASTAPVGVHFATADGSAVDPSDYAAAARDLTFAPGETTKQVSVQVNGDTDVEPDEQFLVNLSAASGARLVGPQGTGTVTNDDAPPPTPTLSVVKEVVNDDGGTRAPADFSLHVKAAGVDVAGSPQAGSAAGTTYTLEPGTYTVSEDELAGYAASFSGDCEASGEVILAAGDAKICTITNDDVAPSLTVVKRVVNDNGGTAVASDWLMHIRSGLPPADVTGSPFPGAGAPGTTRTLSAGSYVVGESGGPSGYSASFAGDCSSTGAVTLAPGESKTCTVTNDDVPVVSGCVTYLDFSPPTGLNLLGSAAVSGDVLRLTTNGGNEQGQAWLTTRVAAASGFVSEFEFQFTEQAGIGDEDGPGADGITFAIQNQGADATGSVGGSLGYDGLPKSLVVEFDTFNNGELFGDPNGNHVAVHSRGTAPNGPGDASDSLLGVAELTPLLQDGAVHRAKVVYDPAGSLRVYVDDLLQPVLTVAVDLATKLGLDNGTAFVGFTSATGLGAENHDIRNWRFCPEEESPAPRLRVVKEVVNDDGGSKAAGDFSVHVKQGGAEVAGSPQPGSASGSTYTLEPGTFTVSEDGVAGYEGSFSGNCDASGEVTLAAGDSKTCTITNDDVAPSLTVVKRVVNDDGGAAAAGDWTMHVKTGVPPVDVAGKSPFPGEADPGTTRTLSAGAYVVSESGGPAGYAVSFSGDCNGSGQVTLEPGQRKTCTVTNDDVAPTLKVVKQVVNDDGGTKGAGDFSVHVKQSGTDVAGSPEAGSAAGTTYTLDPGFYSVSEDTVAGYTGSFSGDCEASGEVLLALGDTKTCTVTNDDVAPSLTVVKRVVNDNGGTAAASDWLMHIRSGAPPADVPGKSPFPGQPEPGTTRELSAGSYVVGESGGPSGYSASFSGDCSSTGAVTLQVGESKTCTVTNDDVAPTLKVVKQVVNDDGGTKGAGDFSVHVKQGGADVAGSPQAGSAAGTTYTLDPGFYSVSEDTVAGYTGSFSGDCEASGEVILAAGDAKICTITNDDVAPSLTVVKRVVNDNGGTAVASDWLMHIRSGLPPADVTGSPFPGAGAPGTTRTLSAGSYVVGESGGPSGYSASFAGDCSSTGAVTLAPGESKTCTVTNDDVPVVSGCVTYLDFSPPTGLNLLGSAAVSGDVLRLTTNGGNEQGQAWLTTRVAAASGFVSEFEFQFTEQAGIGDEDGPGADGITFAIQNQGADATGSVGGSLGYDGLPKSLVVEFDTFNNGELFGDPNGNHVAVHSRGTAPNGPGDASDSLLGVAELTPLLQDGAVHRAKVVYDPAGSLRVYVDDLLQPVLTVAVDLATKLGLDNGTAFVGFTSATGLGAENHDIRNWRFCPEEESPAPRLRVVKEVVNDDGGSKAAGDFSVHVKQGGAEVAGSPQPGSASGSTYTLEPGTFTVSEDGVAGYEGSFSGNCDASGEVTLAAGDSKTCTITNDDVAPSLTVVKRVVNDDGGAAAAGDWTMHVKTGVPPVDVAGKSPFPGEADPGTTRTLSAGAYVVSESGGPAGYAVSFSGDCNGSGQVTLEPGQRKTCTVTNDDVAPTLKVVKQVVNDDGGTKGAGDFSVHVKQSGTDVAGSPEAGSAAGTTYTLDPGFYSVSEDTVAGYTGSFSGDCEASGEVLLALGDTKTCTVTNDDVAPSLTVVKRVVNDNGGTAAASDWLMHIRSGAPPADVPGKSPFPGQPEPGTTRELSAGSYVVGESGGPSGYSASFSGDCSSTGAVTLQVGESKTCTVTNDDVAPTLKVVKQVVNDDGGTKGAGDFSVHVKQGGADVAGSPQAGSAAGTTYTLDPGFYSVSEDTVAGYTGSFSGDCEASGEVILAAGDAKICTITNDDVAPSLTVVKRVVNDNGGTAVASDWLMHIRSGLPPADVTGSPFPGAGAPGTTRTLSAGSYVVGESGGPSGYSASFAGDCSSTGAVTLAPGESKTCTITNDDDQPPPPAPTLTVVKRVVNDNGGTAVASDWMMHIRSGLPSADVPGSPFPGAGAPGTTRTLSAGSYEVDESGGPSGYTKSFSGDCNASGQVTLALGENKTCTVTNDDIAPRLRVVKRVVNDNGGTRAAGDFTIHVKAGATDVAGSPRPGSESGTTYTLAAGSYTVSEDPVGGYAAAITGDCAASGAISLAPGDNKTCTITNNDVAPPPPDRADVRLAKTGPPSPPELGDRFAYTITVSNAGPAVARGVIVTDDLPRDLVLAGVPTGCVSTPIPGSRRVTCSLGDIAPGGGSTRRIVLTVRARIDCEFVGTSGADSDADIGSSGSSDVICGAGGRDRFSGDGGNDRMYGYAPPGMLPARVTNTASATSTTLDPNPGNNTGSSSVTVGGSHDGGDTINGEAGSDRLFGANGDDALNGGAGADDLLGNDDNDLLSGANGSDTLSGGAGADEGFGGDGEDELQGGSGTDRLHGGDDNDRIDGGPLPGQRNRLWGDRGNSDFCSFGPGSTPGTDLRHVSCERPSRGTWPG